MATQREENADMDELLREITRSKHKELMLRAEKERVRKEIEQLRAGTLWIREAEKQQQLLEIRREREDLQLKERAEAQKLTQLNESFKQRELSVRKRAQPNPNPLQQAGLSLTSSATISNNSNDTATRAPLSVEINPSLSSTETNADCSSSKPHNNQDQDRLQQLLTGIDPLEQQRKIERLQKQLSQLESGRQEMEFDLQGSADRYRIQQTIRKWTSPKRVDLKAVHFDSQNEEHMNHNESLQEDCRSNLPRSTSCAPRTNEPPDHQPPIKDQAFKLPEVIHASAATGNVPQGMLPPGTVKPGNGVPSMGFTSVNPFLQWPMTFGSVQPSIPSAYLFPHPAPFQHPALYASQYFPPHAYLPGATQMTLPESILSNQPILSAIQQQEQEIRRMEQHLEAQRIAESQRQEENEFIKLQERLVSLQKKMSALTDGKSSTNLDDEVKIESPDSSKHVNPQQSDEDEVLKQLQRQHMQAITKVRHERDLIEEQEKLDDLKERIQRRRDDKIREQEHEQWLANQKRELVAMRLQRAAARERGGSGANTFVVAQLEQEGIYDPDQGICIGWDYVTGLPTSTETLQVTFAVYAGKINRSPFTVLQTKESESHGPTHKRFLLSSHRQLKKLAASTELRLVIEVSDSIQRATEAPAIKSLGWTVVDLFRATESNDLALVTGFVKVPLKQTSMPDPSKILLEPPSIPDCGDITLHFRISHGKMSDVVAQYAIDPDVHAGLYHLPQDLTSNSPSKILSSSLRKPSMGSISDQMLSKTRNETLNPSSIAVKQDQPVISSQNFESKPAAQDSPDKQRDFLDIERLRLISASSSRPGSTRPRTSATGNGKDRARLPPVDESDNSKLWLHVDKTLERQQRQTERNLFQQSDGFDLFIDGARCLPDNVTLTKVTVAAKNIDHSVMATENGSSVASLDEDAYNPVFDLYVEYREKAFNPTVTLVIRIDTIEVNSKSPVIVGYALFPVFLDIETLKQPARSSIPQFMLNEGAFQIPVHTNVALKDPTEEFSAGSCDAFPRIPCATLLLRVLRAKTSEDGLNLLSRKNFPSQEWEAKGLLEPPQPYEEKAYDSLHCIPTPIEQRLYYIRCKQRKTRPIRERLERSLPVTEANAEELLKAKPTAFIDLRYVCRYQSKLGFRVAIDAMNNAKVKTGNGFFKVLFSVSPPASLYQAIPLTSDAYFTTTTDWTSLQTSPEFSDGFVTLYDSPPDGSLVVIFDIRCLARNNKTGAITSQPFGWTFLPVLTEFVTVAAGNFQLPIFQGEVKTELIQTQIAVTALMEELASEKRKPTSPAFVDSASLFVRLEDLQVPNIAGAPIVNAVASKMIPSKSLAKYAYDSVKVNNLRKKMPMSKLLPINSTEKQFEKELNVAFAQLVMTTTEPEHEQPPQASPAVATATPEPAAAVVAAPDQNGVPATESLLRRLRKKPFKFSSYAREDHGKAIYCVSFCDVLPIYERMFAAAGGNRVTIYECLDNGDLDVVQVYVDGDAEEQYFTTAWTVDLLTGSPLLAVAGFRGHIKVINCVTQSVITVLSGHGNSVNELKFHPVDRSLLLSASKDESVRLWNTLTGVCVAIFAGHLGHRDEVLSLDVHLKGSCFVSAGMDNTIKIWDLEDEVVQTAISKSYTEPRPADRPFDTKFVQFPAFATSKVHADYVDCVRMVGDLILSKSTGNKVIFWKPNPSRGKDAVTVLREYAYKDAELWFMKFGLDSQLEVMAVGNKKGVVSVFDLDAEPERALCKLNHPSCKSTIRQVCFSHSGRTIISCSDDATVWRWDLP